MMLRQAARAGAQSGTIMTLADMGTQLFVEGETKDEYSVERTLRWTVVGLTLHGPYFLAGFSMLDKQFGAATSLRIVAMKTATAQIVVFPPYLVALFGAMGYMEGHPDIAEKIHTQVPKAFTAGCVFWPIANVVNFTFVPPALRVPYLACSAGVWNSYLSWTNSKSNEIGRQEKGR
ncbi:unnamed protein product [Cylindrotheca closterium]|uniref:Peroxisomal membrane protein MPV17 n=1 Tax=Cylindrotheca closterium TaxID=2856 RepID=A0AAD2FC22_9STRA|nr:unnamed protein product [Cylindrotheca closterium]